MAAFMLRQPAITLIKIFSKRRSKDELKPAYFWFIVYGLIGLLALITLVMEGFGYIVYLAIPGIPIFAWHLWLVSKREERKQVNIEIIATGVLSLAAPASYWVGIGGYDPYGWWLWILIWLQTAASIVYAYLRLEQRNQAKGPVGSGHWKMGWRAGAYTSFNLASVLGYHTSGNWMETHTHRHTPVHCKHHMDDHVHHLLEVVMDELKWEVLTEVQGRMQADLLKSYFEAYGIEIELFQEAVGHHIYPVTINGLGVVQLFVAKEQADTARKLLDEYNNSTEDQG